MDKIIHQLRKELAQLGDAKVREGEKRFFKEAVRSYGVKTAIVAKIGKKYFQEIKDSGKEKVFALCEELFLSGYNEEAWIACAWSHGVRKEYALEDFKTFERWIEKYVDNWAKCDTFCNHTVGEFVEKYPEFVAELKKWAGSENRWMRRASAVSLIIPARRGKFLPEIFAIADLLLEDQDDMVQKGYGWMLKVSSGPHQEEVFRYVMKNKTKMPRTALRYAIEKMPKDLKKEAMRK